ncbi:MAG: ribosome small subunit-dependent GTPase A [Spirochaetia bacterium]
MHTNDIRLIGWNHERNNEFHNELHKINKAKQYCSGRIIGKHHELFDVQGEEAVFLCAPSGSLRKSGLWPAVGDWIVFEKIQGNVEGIIHAVMPRSAVFQRASSGKKTALQVIASNIDFAFIVTAMNGDYNLRRIERYMTLAWDSGAQPVLILNKADLAEDPQGLVSEAELSAPGASVFSVSALTGEGTEQVKALLAAGKTAVMVGSSGAGKSTLLNCLIGTQVQKTNDLRSNDHRGRHTTTTRQLFVLPEGGAIIDTPGLREVGLAGGEESMEHSFSDITALADQCRFNDCTHQHEPGCAVLAATRNGEVLSDRYEAYLKQKRELEFVTNRRNALRKKEEWQKDVAKYTKKLKKKRR